MIKAIFLSLTFFLSACAVTVPQISMEDQSEAERLVNQGTAFLRAGNVADAKSSFNVALELTQEAAAWDGLGCVAFFEGKLEDAERYYFRALQIDSSYIDALGNLALLYEAKGEVAKAEYYYQKAIELDPKNYRVRNNYAVFLKEVRGKSELSKSELNKAKIIAPHAVIEDNLHKVRR